jgi:hypothetical protein
MKRKKKPPQVGGNQNTGSSGDCSSTGSDKQRLVVRFPVLRLYAPLFPKGAQEGGIQDVNDLVNYQRRSAESEGGV